MALSGHAVSRGLMNNPVAYVYEQVQGYLHIAWSRRWYGLATTWFICVAGWLVVASIPDWYTSTARIYIDTESLLRPLLQGITVESNIFEQLDMLQRTLLSRPNMQKLARMTDLDLTAQTAPETDALIDRLATKIRLSMDGRSLFSVSYSDAQPEVAKRVVEALLTLFVESNLGISRRDMDVARRFLDDQIAQYEKELKAAEARLAEFRKANIGYLPGEENYYQRLQGARGELAKTAAALTEAISQRDELTRQLGQVPEFFESATEAGAGPPTDTTLRILDLEKTLDALLTRYTEKHPDVVAIRRQIDDLKKQLEGEQEAYAANVGDTKAKDRPVATVPNPVYQQIKFRLVELEGMIATLRSREVQQKAGLVILEGQVKTVPDVEAKLSDLNRDYGIIRKNFEEMLSRREAAKISEDVDARANKVNFRVIDPPQVPLQPSGPNRVLYLSAVLVAGLIGGVVFALFLSQVRDVFVTIASLKERYDYPVLGGISAVMSASAQRRRVLEIGCFGLVLLGLLGAYGGLMAIELVANNQVV
ncbi:MAG: XrtA system polysaccharide chain length determinant [Alphaproteobacteria bacterium]